MANPASKAPVTVTEAVRIALVAGITAMWGTLDDATVNSLATAAALILSAGLSKFLANRPAPSQGKHRKQ